MKMKMKMAKKSLILPQWRTIKSNTRTVYKPPANRRYTVVVKYYSVGRMQKKKFLISIYGKAGTLYPASNKQALSLQANKYAMHACSTILFREDLKKDIPKGISKGISKGIPKDLLKDLLKDIP